MKLLSEYLLKLHRGSLEIPVSEFKNWALNEAKSILPFDSCVWGAGSWIDGQPRIHTIHLHQVGDDFVSNWMQYQHQDKLARDVALNINKSFNVDVEYSGPRI